MDWADVIVFDDVISGPDGFGKVADELRAKGKLVVGGSAAVIHAGIVKAAYGDI